MATYPKKMRLTTLKYDRTEENKPVRYKKGDIVALTEAEYLAFGDKFEELPAEIAKTDPKPASGAQLKPAKTPTAPPGAKPAA
jgi:hypothetical protein